MVRARGAVEGGSPPLLTAASVAAAPGSEMPGLVGASGHSGVGSDVGSMQLGDGDTQSVASRKSQISEHLDNVTAGFVSCARVVGNGARVATVFTFKLITLPAMWALSSALEAALAARDGIKARFVPKTQGVQQENQAGQSASSAKESLRDVLYAGPLTTYVACLPDQGLSNKHELDLLEKVLKEFFEKLCAGHSDNPTTVEDKFRKAIPKVVNNNGALGNALTKILDSLKPEQSASQKASEVPDSDDIRVERAVETLMRKAEASKKPKTG